MENKQQFIEMLDGLTVGQMAVSFETAEFVANQNWSYSDVIQFYADHAAGKFENESSNDESL